MGRRALLPRALYALLLSTGIVRSALPLLLLLVSACAWSYPPANKLGPPGRPHPTPGEIRTLLDGGQVVNPEARTPLAWLHPKTRFVIGAADVPVQVLIEAHQDNRAFVLTITQGDMRVHGWAKSLNGALDDTLLPPSGRELPVFRLTGGDYELRASVLGAGGIIRHSITAPFTVCGMGEDCTPR